jgi:hypothetical protein
MSLHCGTGNVEVKSTKQCVAGACLQFGDRRRLAAVFPAGVEDLNTRLANAQRRSQVRHDQEQDAGKYAGAAACLAHACETNTCLRQR